MTTTCWFKLDPLFLLLLHSLTVTPIGYLLVIRAFVTGIVLDALADDAPCGAELSARWSGSGVMHESTGWIPAGSSRLSVTTPRITLVW
jgi:hypothetical protein